MRASSLPRVKPGVRLTRGDDRRPAGGEDASYVEGAFATILFTELIGLASLFGDRGDEAADALRREHFRALRAALADHGGREVKSTGDGVMVEFPSAVAALRCAVAMQQAVAAAGELELSAGLDAGEPLREGDDLYGTPVRIAERLCDAARPGEILASEVVCRIAAPRLAQTIEAVRQLRLAGIGERVPAARVMWREDAGGEAVDREPSVAVRQIDVVVADDQELVRSGFRVILEDEPDMRVVGEAPDGATAVDFVLRTRPDVVLMDIRMP